MHLVDKEMLISFIYLIQYHRRSFLLLDAMDKQHRCHHYKYAAYISGYVSTKNTMILWGHFWNVSFLIGRQRVVWRIDSEHDIMSIAADCRLRISQ